MLLGGLDGFTAALATATPSGIVIVEEAIDKAISDIKEEIGNLDPEAFDTDAFIPASAFGAADRSPEVALHHTRAHRVIKATLVGVRDDLARFKQACIDAREIVKTADSDSAADLQARLLAVQALSSGTNSGHANQAYNQAVNDNAGAVATEENPDDEGSAP